MIFAAILFCGVMCAQAQVMKAADLEKYAKQRYGEKWLDAAKNLAGSLQLDKNQSLTYQEVIEAPGKTKSQLYVALNYWATATFKDKQAITLNDKENGCIIISSTIKDIVEHIGTLNGYSVSITPIIRIDIKDGRVQHYPFVEKDAQKRTCSKALVMTHAYSNAIMDKVSEAVQHGLVGNDDDNW